MGYLKKECKGSFFSSSALGKNQLRSAESDLLINFKGLPLLPGSRLILARWVRTYRLCVHIDTQIFRSDLNRRKAMRRKLTITSFLVIAIMAVASVASASNGLSIGGGVTLTESASGVAMGSRIDACRKIAEKNDESGRFEFTYRPIAAWASSTGMMPFLVMSKAPGRPVYRAMVDFNNVENIDKVELTPDHGLTTWEATNVPKIGYMVEIPYMEPGARAFEWKVTSRDKKNRLMIIFIPISWNSNRTNGVVQQIMVQSAPEECWNFSDEQWVSLLSPAFQPLTALPDPGYLAKRAAQQQTLNQMTQPASAPTPAPTSKPAIEPRRPRPVADQPKPVVKHEEKRNDDGYVPESDSEVYDLDGEYQLVLTGEVNRSFAVNLTGRVAQGSKVVFDRKGREAASASITDVKSGKIFAEIDSVGSKGIQPGDKILFDMEEGQ